MLELTVGDTVLLEPSSNYGTIVINSHGERWCIVGTQNKQINPDLTEMLILVESCSDYDLRWISLLSDNNFKIKGIAQ